MTNKTKELVAAGHALAKELHCAESAALVRELATQLDVQLARSNALAAENAGLKSALNPEAIPDAAVEAFTETAIMGHDWNETGEWSWVENDTDVIHAVLEAIKTETPATDAYLAEVRAQGVEMFAAHKRERQQALRSRNMRMSEEAAGMAADAEDFADQLRKGVQS